MMTAFWLLGTGTGSLARWLVMYSQSNIYLKLKASLARRTAMMALQRVHVWCGGPFSPCCAFTFQTSLKRDSR
uniref:Secreted protein n=1 Tax=Setaria viridis TaxID=4556 RepID=A0A4V6D5N0_SETVI|nr:hypothetical protein SEVIR_6G211250v2 [Setaria viridis]